MDRRKSNQFFYEQNEKVIEIVKNSILRNEAFIEEIKEKMDTDPFLNDYDREELEKKLKIVQDMVKHDKESLEELKKYSLLLQIEEN